MSDKRQKNQLVLAFTEEGRSEAPKASQEGTESLTAKCETERPARQEQLMEEVCERENCWQAYKRVKANKGSPGIDGMRVGELLGLPEAALALRYGNSCCVGPTNRNRYDGWKSRSRTAECESWASRRCWID